MDQKPAGVCGTAVRLTIDRHFTAALCRWYTARFRSVYLLNDSIDIQADRQHPRKQYRPIAMGQVSVGLALSTSALLAVMSLTLAAALSRQLAGVILAYVLIQTGYCLRLKQEPLLDLFCIATGFLLRAELAGLPQK